MQYTADELKGAGTPIKNPLIAGNTLHLHYIDLKTKQDYPHI